MALITSATRVVYRSPTKGRSYLTLRAASEAESRAQLDKKYPQEQPEYENGMCYYGGYHWSTDARLVKAQKRLARLIRRAAKQKDTK